MSLGTCLFCGHALEYARPGSPPGDAAVDETQMYDQLNIWRDYSLVDVPAVYGKFCPLAHGQAGQAIGQLGVHQLVPDPSP